MTDKTPASPAPVKKKFSLGRLIFRLCLVLVLLVVVALASLYFFRNQLVAAGVVRGGKYATDLETALAQADLNLGGSLKLDNLDMKNVKGYSAPNLLTMKSCAVSVDTGSLLSNNVVVHNIDIDGLEITLEQNGMNNNLNDLLATIKKKTPAAGDSQNKSPGKNLKIGTLKLTGTKVHVRGIASLDLNLPDLEITDPTNPDGRPMKIADLVGQVLIRLAKQIIENPALPGNFKDAMKNATAIVDNLKGQLDKNLKQLPFKDLKLPDSGPLKDASKNLENLNPFDKKDSKK